MANTKLYPPIIEGAIPAFSNESGLVIPYTLNRAIGYNEITGFSLIVKSTITNKIISNKTINIVSKDRVNFGTVENLQPGGFYKVQIAFMQGENIGIYSNVGVVKYIGAKSPKLEIQDDGGVSDSFTVKYSCEEDISEKVYSYSFSLYDNLNNLIDTSGELLHNSTKDIGYDQYDSWSPSIGLDNGSSYYLTYEAITINGFKINVTKQIIAKKDEEGYLPRGIELTANFNKENGYVNLKVGSSISNDTRHLIYGTFYIFKTSSKDNYSSKYKIAYFKLENQDLFEKEFKDFTVESGYAYKYVLQQVNDHGIYSEEIYSNQGQPLEVYYEHLYLFDGDKQLKIKFTPKVSTFKNTVLETKIDTIGSQYPYIFRNGTVYYKEFQISGLISYHMDEENLFLKDQEIWDVISREHSLNEKNTPNKIYWTHNLTDESIAAEKVFKNKVLTWLNNGEIKLLKSPTEGNYLVRLMNVTLAPTDTVGRMLHTFTATAYEIEDLNKHSFIQALNIDKENKYIGYRTIPLYDFPTTRIVGKSSNSNYIAINNNTLYEIIGNNALEYVVAARFEDIKPGTKFKVILERGLELFVFNLQIGATGTYRIPRELGYHIRSIKLVEPDWVTDDSGLDIVNNRGQITYEFERKAKHSNFNDITAIHSGIAISQPWYPAWYNVTVKEPIVSSDGKPLYSYRENGQQDVFIEIAYFDGKEGPQIKGIDYVYDEEENKYYQNEIDKTELKLSKTEGKSLTSGDVIYIFENYKKLSGKDDFGSYFDFKYENQRLNDLIPVNSINYYYQVYNKRDSEACWGTDEKGNKGFIAEKSNENGYYKQLILENNSFPTAELFIPIYNSQGNQIYKEIVKENKMLNPYYSKVIYDQDEVIDYVTAPVYKLTPLYVEKTENNSINLGMDTIYKNFIPNKYYNQTNVNGDYYNKEDMLNIYTLDFELIQVFYEENLENTQNFNFNNGKVQYVDIIEDGSYQYTQRFVSGISNSNEFLGSDVIVADDEMFADYFYLGNSVEEKEFIQKHPYLNVEEINDNNLEILNSIYNNKISSTEVKELIKLGVDIYVKTKLDGFSNGYYYKKISTTINNNNEENVDNSPYYLNLRAQAAKNYSAMTTPGPNEIIIVYENDYNNPVTIDLTNKFSYQLLGYDYEDGYNNIAGIYLGKNVRGFATYKRKLYEYHALVADGTYMDLTIKGGLYNV